MHPVIRVAGLVALAVGLASAAPAALALATPVLALPAAIHGELRAAFLSPVRRLRWLLVSVTALYAFLIPGDALVVAWGSLSPTWPGLVQGLLRSWMLLLMAGAARLLMNTTSREDVMGALYWIARPFDRLGVDTARFSLRLVLTLEYALAFRRSAVRVGAAGRRGGFAQRAVELARSRLREARDAAERARPGPVTIPLTGAPPWWQWAGPAALLVALLGLPGLT